MEVSGQIHTTPPHTRYPFDWKLGEPQNRYGRDGEEKKSQPQPVIEPCSSNLLVQLLFWLSYTGSFWNVLVPLNMTS
jgi:hypothetical protein